MHREDGSLRDAIGEIDTGRDVVVHVHWEEFVLRDCRSESEAGDEARTFSRQIRAIRERNGALVWTVHNEVPHVIPYRRPFLAMRRSLATEADAILVHDAASADVLARQVEVDRAKVHVLPHPSYLGRLEDEATLLAGLSEPFEPRIQGFGWIRLQKGFGEMIDMLPVEFLRAHGAHIRISGDDVEAAAVIARAPERADVQWDLRHVPDAEVPRLLRSASCVVLPYERVLTSGVALLAMSVGAMIVAVDTPQLRALLPAQSRRFTYPRGDGEALRRAIGHVFALPEAERRDVVAANLGVARALRPETIARRLADLYDRVRARRAYQPVSASATTASSTIQP